MNSLLGTTLLNRFHVDAYLGRGGMADVYRVYDKQRAVYLAMKLLREDLAEDKIFLRRFHREGQNLARLQHPHIVRFYGLEQDGDLAFMLLDYVEGTTLRKEIFHAMGPIPGERITEVFRPVSSALHYAHHMGVVHCDVKPSNIMQHKNGTILLSDFGIARLTESATMTMVGIGTPAYMAPEQVIGETPSPPTDIYSLGVVLYEMLTGGERPFTGDQASATGTTAEKVRWEHLHLSPPSPRKYSPSISHEIEAVVMICLEKKPSRRYPDTLTFLEDLENALIKESVPQFRDTGLIKTSQANKEKAEHKSGSTEEVMKAKAQDLNSQIEVAEPEFEKKSRKYLDKPWLWIVGLVLLALTIIGVFSIPAPQISEVNSEPANQKPQIFAVSSPINRLDIYFTSNREGKPEIYHLDAEGQVKRITKTPGDGVSMAPIPSSGGGLYFTSNRQGKYEIYFMDRNGQVSRITKTPGQAESLYPMPAPAGGLYFTSNREGKYEIYYLDSKGIIRRITRTPGEAESFDPFPTENGGLYFTSTRNGKPEIFFLSVSGKISRITRTPGEGGSFDPYPTINGGVYFTSDRNGKRDIYYLDKNGKIKEITNTKGELESWNPVPTGSAGLYFTSNRDGKPEVYFMNNAGKVSRIIRSPALSYSHEPVLGR